MGGCIGVQDFFRVGGRPPPREREREEGFFNFFLRLFHTHGREIKKDRVGFLPQAPGGVCVCVASAPLTPMIPPSLTGRRPVSSDIVL